MAKKNLMVYIEAEVVEKAKDLGLNISKVCENCLKDMIRRIEGSNPSKDCPEQVWCGRRDSNPGSRLGKPKS
jgi:hypothetical protein